MNRRSQGIKVRKEDDITDYGFKEMLNYINSIYETDYYKAADFGLGAPGFQELEVNIEMLGTSTRGVKFYYNRDKEAFQYFEIDFKLKGKYEPEVNLENIFDEKFGHIDKTIYLYPKEKDVITNQDVIYIIDKLLSTVRNPIIHKIKK
jgi:hypothetical protein